jgi:nifR3 family TIM-barrel protein
MKIGTIALDGPLIMAPLAGITDLPFRLIIKQVGCSLVCSEMISANGLVHQSYKTLRMLGSDPAEKPLSVQIFGADPAVMVEAARIVEESGADILDINFGCSVRKVVKTGSGVALMRTPHKAETILTTIRQSIKIPLTIKIRSGWNRSGDQAVEIARMAETCGIDAITVHPRTASQGFGGVADWDLIRRVKQAVRIPVVGNGDVRSPQDAIDMFQHTGCDGVMIGRAAIGHPWIFTQTRDFLSGRTPKRIDDRHRRRDMIRYLDAAVNYYGESIACRMMRSRLGWFVKGLSHNVRFREAIKTIENRSEALSLIDKYFSVEIGEKGQLAGKCPTD